MPLIELTNLDDARLRVFSSMTDSELRDPKQLVGLRLATGSEVSDEGLFIAESRNVIDRAMDAGLAPFALLTDKRWAPACEELFARIDAAAPTTPLFVGTHQQVFELTGYERTRGPLAAFHRPALPDVATLLNNATRVAILEDVTNFTNIGAIFRSAAALGWMPCWLPLGATTRFTVAPTAFLWEPCSRYHGRASGLNAIGQKRECRY